jgi:hypothetical protein
MVLGVFWADFSGSAKPFYFKKYSGIAVGGYYFSNMKLF